MTHSWLFDTVTTDLDRALHYTLLWGLDGVELRTVGRAGDRVPHVNESRLKRRIAETEVTIDAVVPGLFEGPGDDRPAMLNELSLLDESLAFCRRVGCTRVVVSGFSSHGPDAVSILRKAGDRAQKAGVRVLVLNERDMACRTGGDLVELLASVQHAAIGAAWQPYEDVEAAFDPMAAVSALVPNLGLLRCRDGVTGGADRLPGAGEVGWAALLSSLQQGGYTGPISLEMHSSEPGKFGLAATNALRQLIRETRIKK